MKKRKFADGGETTEMMPSAKPEGGRFSEDTYSRARRFVESGGKKEEEEKEEKEEKEADKKARKVEVEPSKKVSKPAKAAASLVRDIVEDAPKAAPAKRPGMMARLRADSAMREKALKRMREETPSLSLPSPTTTNDPMGKNFGAGRVNPKTLMPYKKGGKVAKYASGGLVGSASQRADGVATKGKTKCRIV